MTSSARWRWAPALLVALALAPSPAAGQLRPLDPLDWRIFDPQTNLIAGAGGSVLARMLAPLAGTRGMLTELGSYQLLWRTGRMGIEITGTALLRFREDTTLFPPAADVRPARDGVRQEPGPLHVGTLLRLTPERWSTDVALRFGTHIPTTSDESGLERDRTDFYALLGARWRRGGWSVAGESGVGINGTRAHDYPQSDVWSYTLQLERRWARAALFGAVAGHQDGRSLVPAPGNEDQGELRAGLRLGHRWWLQTTYIHGYRGPAPKHGLLLAAGLAHGCRTDCLPSR